MLNANFEVTNWKSYQSEYQRQKGYRHRLHKGVTQPVCTTDTESDTDTEKEDTPRSLELTQKYFLDLKSTQEEASMFYDHFTSNGWKVSGRTPMKNWKAAARNWMHRSNKVRGETPSPVRILPPDLSKPKDCVPPPEEFTRLKSQIGSGGKGK